MFFQQPHPMQSREAFLMKNRTFIAADDNLRSDGTRASRSDSSNIFCSRPGPKPSKRQRKRHWSYG
ncbi:unnamed protein product [Nesidiocoris tenuis]|uniref:Uncharacterized protein n=1 Tax=Nesidiocoris tenuis TaxID=355587 RepID=A0A6H5H8Y0_9HEMI|nr:unnamed protein product [Nesidiocoris tenuis]